jgi:hypothetical protein
MRIISFIPLLCILIFSSCLSEQDTEENIVLTEDEKFYFFYYEFKDNSEELTAAPVELQGSKTIPSAIGLILKRLSGYYSQSGDIIFELNNITTIKTTPKNYRFAVVNINDSTGMMMRSYFQGSTGGMITQSTILLNLLQPQLNNYLDGVIIHLNNQLIGEMDHVNFTGIKDRNDISGFIPVEKF